MTRAARRFHPVGSHRPRVEDDPRRGETVPMWLRELRRDTREQVL